MATFACLIWVLISVLGLGINRIIGTKTVKPSVHPSMNSKLIWEGGLRFGRRQISIDDRTNIEMGSVELNLIYPQSPIARWRVGLNMFYDRSYIHTDLAPLPKKSRLSQTSEIALVGGHEYRMGKIGFITEMGLYLYRPSKKNECIMRLLACVIIQNPIYILVRA